MVDERPANYSEFLLSPEWRKLRAEVIAAAHGICSVCDNPATEVHHYHYIDLLNPGLLVALCHACHEDHDAERIDDPILHLSFSPLIEKMGLRRFGANWSDRYGRKEVAAQWLEDARARDREERREWAREADYHDQNYCANCEAPISHLYRLCYSCNREEQY